MSACAELVSGEKVCDIGTDHAYLVAELLSAGKCRTAVAADINEKPLACARATLEKYGLSDKVELILSDGLKNIPPDGITDVVIAGMGAELIFDIISDCEWLKNGVNLVLQPMTRTPYLRKMLCRNGYQILKEIIVIDGKYCYTVINARYSGILHEIDEIPEKIGTADLSLPGKRLYVQREYERIYKIGKSLADSGHKAEAASCLALADKIKAILERND